MEPGLDQLGVQVVEAAGGVPAAHHGVVLQGVEEEAVDGHVAGADLTLQLEACTK